MAIFITGFIVGGFLWLIGRSMEDRELTKRREDYKIRAAARLRELTPWEED